MAIVNASFARHFFGARPALGGRVTSFGGTYDIVGVVGDAKDQHLRDTPLPMMYVSWMQREEADQRASYAYLVRTGRVDPLRLVPALAPLVRAADPQLRVWTADLYETLIDRSISNERVLATRGGLFGTLGLMIAAVGMFGVLAFQVARRTNELGVRVVLGASRCSVMRLVCCAVWRRCSPRHRHWHRREPEGQRRRARYAIWPDTHRSSGLRDGGRGAHERCPARRLAARSSRPSRVDPMNALRHE